MRAGAQDGAARPRQFMARPARLDAIGCGHGADQLSSLESELICDGRMRVLANAPADSRIG